MGQDEAIREMSVALSKQLAGLRVGNILMIGSSGTGKTTLMRAVEGYLASDPVLAARSAVVRIHANVLGEEAERGRPGEAVLGPTPGAGARAARPQRSASTCCCGGPPRGWCSWTRWTRSAPTWGASRTSPGSGRRRRC